jgi:hypothetical protein
MPHRMHSIDSDPQLFSELDDGDCLGEVRHGGSFLTHSGVPSHCQKIHHDLQPLSVFHYLYQVCHHN